MWCYKINENKIQVDEYSRNANQTAQQNVKMRNEQSQPTRTKQTPNGTRNTILIPQNDHITKRISQSRDGTYNTILIILIIFINRGDLISI